MIGGRSSAPGLRSDPTPRAAPDGVAAAHRNNFDFIRWLAASMVLMSHEYAVLGRAAEEPVANLTGGFATLGSLGVDIFFVVSGFLVTASAVRSASLAYFIAARALRILPGLVAALLVSVLVIGALATALPLTDYFRDPATWRYLSRGVALHNLQWTLPGVFTGLPLAGVVNGSLWSLWPEVQMYAVVAALGALAWIVRAPRRVVLLVGMIVVAVVAIVAHSDLAGRALERSSLDRLALFFAFGAIIGLCGWRPLAGGAAFALAVAGATFAHHSVFFVPMFDLAVALGVIGVAHAPLGRLRDWGRFGDWSYGMYVYAFPVQQLVAFHFPAWRLPGHFLLAYALTLILGAVSWHVVESPALRLKGRLRPRPAGAPNVIRADDVPRATA